MDWLRRHWFDLGGGLAILVLAGVAMARPWLTPIQTILWISLATLFLHQIEEYRFPGTFPGTINLLKGSDRPDRYPLNAQTSVVVNVGVGWTCYVLAAVLAERAIWLGIATMVVSVGNILAHAVLFPIRGRFLYNPGALTALMLFSPTVVIFVRTVVQTRAPSPIEWGIGIVFGGVLNVVGILKTIEWMKNPDSPYIFEPRMIPGRKL